VVAAAAALQAVAAGAQAAVMAPTELLGEQHHANFRAWLAPLGVEVCWLSAARSRRRRGARPWRRSRPARPVSPSAPMRCSRRA
jgi:ATP-dependent DNA helicase RecG